MHVYVWIEAGSWFLLIFKSPYNTIDSLTFRYVARREVTKRYRNHYCCCTAQKGKTIMSCSSYSNTLLFIKRIIFRFVLIKFACSASCVTPVNNGVLCIAARWTHIVWDWDEAINVTRSGPSRSQSSQLLLLHWRWSWLTFIADAAATRGDDGGNGGAVIKWQSLSIVVSLKL